MKHLYLWIFLAQKLSPNSVKKVNIKAYSQERVDATLTLWIVTDGTKLSPQLVFKWNPFGKVKKRIRSILY